MKRLLLFSLMCVLVGLSSCMDTYYVSHKRTYDEKIQSIQSHMAEQGFNFTGSKTNTRNEAVVAGVSYSRYTGYGTAMANNFITQDTYNFADSVGNTMNYSVSYKAKQTSEGVAYVEDVELCGCETSNPKDYDRLCGAKSSVKDVNDISRDLKIQEMNVVNTSLVAAVVILGLSTIVTLISLSAY